MESKKHHCIPASYKSHFRLQLREGFELHAIYSLLRAGLGLDELRLFEGRHWRSINPWLPPNDCLEVLEIDLVDAFVFEDLDVCQSVLFVHVS